MANLIFFDTEHKYTVDGEEVPSVSELTRFITREVYQDIQQNILDNAAERGTTIHKATEALDKFGSVEIDDNLSGYVKAYIAFLKENETSWDKIEWPINNEKLYAGTIDRYGTVNSKKVIVDIKTAASITGLHKTLYTAGQNLYRMAVEKAGLKVEALYILQLKNDGTYRLHELEIQDELAKACITLHYALKRKKRRSKNDSSD